MKYGMMIAGLWVGLFACHAAAETVRVGAKNFTEQEIVAELVAQLIERYTDLTVERRFGLGGTGVCHAALVTGQLDLYVEYTGTAVLDILKQPAAGGRDEVLQQVARAYLEEFDLEWLAPLGFNNTYALSVRGKVAEEKGWRTVSDLIPAADRLRAGFTSEFIERPDGYPGLTRVYGLRFGSVTDLDPGLMCQAVSEGQVDVISAFATDSRLLVYGLAMLRDDRGFFPPYDAAPVVRGELLQAHPELRAALLPLAGAIDDETMRSLNHQVDEQGRRPSRVARDWLDARRGNAPAATRPARQAGRPGMWTLVMNRRAELARKTGEHVTLTGLALLVAVLAGVPLGVAIHRYRGASAWVLAGAEIVQTVPSLAMLAFLFALYKVLGMWPAVSALVLYALLLIVLNTFTGLKEIPPRIIEAAQGVGMSSRQRLWMVELPLALPIIVAGVRTAAVWTVGIATLSTYIGAGGLGDFISRGLARNMPELTLLGAVPAALMAVVLSIGIRTLERKLARGVS